MAYGIIWKNPGEWRRDYQPEKRGSIILFKDWPPQSKNYPQFSAKARPLTTSTETSNSRQKRQHTRSDREFQKQNRNVPRPQVPRLTTVDKKDRWQKSQNGDQMNPTLRPKKNKKIEQGSSGDRTNIIVYICGWYSS
jgi:hypothetical protein